MGPGEGGAISVSLTAEEAAALERAIRECTTNTGSADVKPLKGIQQKLKDARAQCVPAASPGVNGGSKACG